MISILRNSDGGLSVYCSLDDSRAQEFRDSPQMKVRLLSEDRAELKPMGWIVPIYNSQRRG